MTINPGATFADGSVTIEKLHALVDSATIQNLQATQLASGLEGIYPTQDASPSEGTNYLATATGRIQVYDGSAWNGQPDGVEGVDWFYMQNWSGEDCPAGGCVVAHRASGWPRFNQNQGASGVAPHAVGFANTTIASGATGRIDVRGRLVVWKTSSPVSAGDWVLAPTNASWAVSGEDDPTSTSGLYDGAGELLGVFLEDTSGGEFTAWAEIWR